MFIRESDSAGMSHLYKASVFISAYSARFIGDNSFALMLCRILKLSEGSLFRLGRIPSDPHKKNKAPSHWRKGAL